MGTRTVLSGMLHHLIFVKLLGLFGRHEVIIYVSLLFFILFPSHVQATIAGPPTLLCSYLLPPPPLLLQTS